MKSRNELSLILANIYSWEWFFLLPSLLQLFLPIPIHLILPIHLFRPLYQRNNHPCQRLSRRHYLNKHLLFHFQVHDILSRLLGERSHNQNNQEELQTNHVHERRTPFALLMLTSYGKLHTWWFLLHLNMNNRTRKSGSKFALSERWSTWRVA